MYNIMFLNYGELPRVCRTLHLSSAASRGVTEDGIRAFGYSELGNLKEPRL